ncbi:MAG TPA: divalent metal cation transporter [Thermoanaerobaculia bacterium]|nr:divalent metal cation transporter [Thermoanaerobaculia bacterium]
MSARSRGKKGPLRAPGSAAPDGRPRRGLLARLGAVFGVLGPGLITGAADDDPSGIATYSIAGAALGTRLLWCAGLTWPLMAAVQMTCARVGMVTGEGLGTALKKKLSRPMLSSAATALFLANTINIAADLAGMADAASLLVPLPRFLFVVLFAVAITWATVRLRYEQISRVLKWLALALFAYVVVAVRVVSNWGPVLKDAVLPTLPHGSEAWSTLVAILGTTISPYLFFWQASLEVEEEKAAGHTRVEERRGTTWKALVRRWFDVGVGTFFSNFVMFFVIVTTAFTLNRHGITHPRTSLEIARALEPLAGRFAELLYAVGLIGVGLLAIPTLSGSAAYAFAETFGWRQGLDRGFRGARSFYLVVIGSTALAVAADLAKVSAVGAMYWSAVINGLLAPVLLVSIYAVATDRKIMQNEPITTPVRVVLAATCALMLVAAVGMFVF